VASKQPRKRELLAKHLRQTGAAAISEADSERLAALLAPISESYLRKLLRSAGLPLAPLVEGVRQDSFGELERTLLALSTEYEKANLERDLERARRIRRLVIQAKDHARWAQKRFPPGDPGLADKQEMILWMLTWLENPGVMPQWVTLRKRLRERERRELPA